VIRRLLLLLLPLLLAAPAHAATTEALLDSLQRTGFLYFWEQANPANGMVKDRSTPGSVSSIACTGFGLSAITVGIDHGWVSRAQGADRVRTTLRTFWNGTQSSAASGTIGYQGLFYHWLDMTTATRTWDSELSTIDTALLMAGILDAGAYFDGPDTVETEIRVLADTLYRRANWNFMRNFGSGIYMGWKPGTGFSGFPRWIGYNEAMILYLLALGSPTKPVPWDPPASNQWTVWTGGYQWQTHYGYSYVIFPPLFGHQYSHVWVDFRNYQDPYMQARGIDYFENSRRATLAQRAYSIANPEGWVGYSDSLWGITASDIQNGYLARGAPPEENDNGTLVPTAAISSIPFAPDEVIPVIHTMWNQYKPQLWGRYGFKDAFNPTTGWFATDVLGIDQGPIVLMIENHLTGAVWERFMQIPYIQSGMERAGFVGPLSVGDETGARPLHFAAIEPNPVRGSAEFRFTLPTAGRLRVTVHDIFGREAARPLNEWRAAGVQGVRADLSALAPGVYWARIEHGGRSAARRMVVVR
jgi:hypothetical protein